MNLEQLLAAAEADFGASRLPEAESKCRQALAAAPGNVRAKLVLGIATAKAGQIDIGIGILREVVAADPQNVQGLSWLASLLRKKGDNFEAISAYEQAIQAAPNEAFSHNNLGSCYFDIGRIPEAVACFRKAIALKPDQANFHQNLGVALNYLGRQDEAGISLKRAVTVSDNAAQKHFRSGQLLISEGKNKQAILSFRQALQEDPAFVDAQVELALTLQKEDQTTEAVALLRQLIASDAGVARWHQMLGHALQEINQFEEATASYEKSIALNPQQGTAYLGIVISRKVTVEDRSLIEQMKAALLEDNLLPNQERDLHYALGKSFDDLKDYERAMHHYDLATEVLIKHPNRERTPFDRKAYSDSIDLTIKTFTKEFFQRNRKLGLSSDLPILIVGSPRSGTTLLEQIVSSHPEVAPGGELLFWHNQRQSAFSYLTGGTRDQAKAVPIADEYLQLLRGFGAEMRHVTDKMPMNYHHLGIIHTLFPEARVLHCRRHPVDTCLSIYMNAHSMKIPPFGDDRESIVFGYQGYLRLMEHWRAVLPSDRYMDVDYEDLVADRESKTRQVISFLGLEWDDACLRHETNARSVNTPSRWQVRQPIYRTSVERWRRYEPWLGAFSDLL